MHFDSAGVLLEPDEMPASWIGSRAAIGSVLVVTLGRVSFGLRWATLLLLAVSKIAEWKVMWTPDRTER